MGHRVEYGGRGSEGPARDDHGVGFVEGFETAVHLDGDAEGGGEGAGALGAHAEAVVLGDVGAVVAEDR